MIARAEMVRVPPDGERAKFTIEIGRPTRTMDGSAVACAVALWGWKERLEDVAGEDSLQALCLAMDLVRSLLLHAVEQGTRFLDDDGDPFPIEAYFPPRDETKPE